MVPAYVLQQMHKTTSGSTPKWYGVVRGMRRSWPSLRAACAPHPVLLHCQLSHNVPPDRGTDHAQRVVCCTHQCRIMHAVLLMHGVWYTCSAAGAGLFNWERGKKVGRGAGAPALQAQRPPWMHGQDDWADAAATVGPRLAPVPLPGTCRAGACVRRRPRLNTPASPLRHTHTCTRLHTAHASRRPSRQVGTT